MAPSAVCPHCNSKCAKSSVNACSCVVCGRVWHPACAQDMDPHITPAVLDAIKKSNGSIMFRCGSCVGLDHGAVVSELEAVTGKLNSLDSRLDGLAQQISKEVFSQFGKVLGTIKSDVSGCLEKIKVVEESATSNAAQLRILNNSFSRQFNRSDIVVDGIPSELVNVDLQEIIIKIGKFYKIDLVARDISFCGWIRGKKAILVKLVCISTRDLLMRKYRDKFDLKLCHILETDIGSRVFLNNHLTPDASKFHYICRKLFKVGAIKKFRLLNGDFPRAKIVLPDGVEKVIDSLSDLKLLESLHAENACAVP